MENLLEKVKEFVNDQIEFSQNAKNEFSRGYRIALIDIRDYIDHHQKEKDLIGKYGYFWTDDSCNECIYSRLEKIDFNAKDDKYYITYLQRLKLQFGYKNFSLTIPEHCKNI